MKLADHPTADAPYWRHLRYAAWQEANVLRVDPTLTARYGPLDMRPERLRELCKESPRDYAAIAANRKRAA